MRASGLTSGVASVATLTGLPSRTRTNHSPTSGIAYATVKAWPRVQSGSIRYGSER